MPASVVVDFELGLASLVGVVELCLCIFFKIKYIRLRVSFWEIEGRGIHPLVCA